MFGRVLNTPLSRSWFNLNRNCFSLGQFFQMSDVHLWLSFWKQRSDCMYQIVTNCNIRYALLNYPHCRIKLFWHFQRIQKWDIGMKRVNMNQSLLLAHNRRINWRIEDQYSIQSIYFPSKSADCSLCQ